MSLPDIQRYTCIRREADLSRNANCNRHRHDRDYTTVEAVVHWWCWGVGSAWDGWVGGFGCVSGFVVFRILDWSVWIECNFYIRDGKDVSTVHIYKPYALQVQDPAKPIHHLLDQTLSLNQL